MDQGLRAIQEHVLPDMPILDVLYQSQGELLLIALLCGLSVVFVLLWLVAVWEHTHAATSQQRGRL